MGEWVWGILYEIGELSIRSEGQFDRSDVVSIIARLNDEMAKLKKHNSLIANRGCYQGCCIKWEDTISCCYQFTYSDLCFSCTNLEVVRNCYNN